MGQQFTEISEHHASFINDQKIFFVGTATQESRINMSPKGMDSLNVIGKNRVIWLNVTGSGNETSAHVQENARMTLMFVAFSGKPLILRLYGHAKVIHYNEPAWENLISQLHPIPGARQIFDVSVDLIQTSCGMSVPHYEYVEDREMLIDWAIKKGDDGIKEYWQQKNQFSLDGKPTNILNKST